MLVRVLFLTIACLAVAGCAGQESPQPDPIAVPAPPVPNTLIELGNAALRRGDLDAARDRFQRALMAHSSSVPARTGLGQVALQAGSSDDAERWFRESLARDPRALGALIGLATLEEGRGARGNSFALLARALAVDPLRSKTHSQLAALTGRAPSLPSRTPDDARRRAHRYPYDPRVQLEAGILLAEAGATRAAMKHLVRVLLVGDLDRAATARAFALLQELDPAWAERRLVPVYAYADESLRASPAWRFQLRLMFDWLSNFLDPLLRVRFAPQHLGGFSSEGRPPGLASIGRAIRSQSRPDSSGRGILAAFTGREVSRWRGPTKLGLADFLGRTLIVRLAADARTSHTLAHEILHLYGGVHVADEVPSLLNVSSRSLAVDERMRIDPANAAIVIALRARRFESGGLDQNVFPWIEISATTRAYLSALRLNLAFRRLGVADASERRKLSRFDAARRAREARALDPHLGDVARFAAQLLVRDERPAEGLMLLETAIRLYGSGTPGARACRSLAQQIEATHFPGRVQP